MYRGRSGPKPLYDLPRVWGEQSVFRPVSRWPGDPNTLTQSWLLRSISWSRPSALVEATNARTTPSRRVSAPAARARLRAHAGQCDASHAACRRCAAAVWGVRVDGDGCRSPTIPGVVEDVHADLGNLKRVTLTLPTTSRRRSAHQEDGAGPVTAGDVRRCPRAHRGSVRTTSSRCTTIATSTRAVHQQVPRYVESAHHPLDRGCL